MSESMMEEEPARLEHEDRDKSSIGDLRRFMWKYAWQVLFVLAGLMGGAVWSFASGLASLPRVHRELKVQVDNLATEQSGMKTELKDIAVATWTFVALRCLELSDADFIQTRLPCGDALVRSGIVRKGILK